MENYENTKAAEDSAALDKTDPDLNNSEIVTSKSWSANISAAVQTIFHCGAYSEKKQTEALNSMIRANGEIAEKNPETAPQCIRSNEKAYELFIKTSIARVWERIIIAGGIITGGMIAFVAFANAHNGNSIERYDYECDENEEEKPDGEVIDFKDLRTG